LFGYNKVKIDNQQQSSSNNNNNNNISMKMSFIPTNNNWLLFNHNNKLQTTNNYIKHKILSRSTSTYAKSQANGNAMIGTILVLFCFGVFSYSLYQVKTVSRKELGDDFFEKKKGQDDVKR
jgi:ABC-type multidrug transport system permease subunit